MLGDYCYNKNTILSTTIPFS